MVFEKKHIWLAFFITVAGSAMILAGCGEDDPVDPVEPEPEPGPTLPYTPAENTTILPADDQSTVLAYDSGTGAMTLDETSEYAKDITVGTVLVGQDADAAPDGFLRNVTDVTTDGGQILLETTPALMTDAFVQMAVADTFQLHPSQIKTSTFYNGTTFVPDKDDKTFSVEIDCVLYDHDDDRETTDDQIRLVGQYNFNASLFVGIDISGSTLDKLEVFVDTDDVVALQILAGYEFVFESEQEFDIWDVRLGAIPLGGVVWIVPTLSVEAHVDGDLTVTFEAAITYTQEIRNGFVYDKDASAQFETISGSEKEFTFEPPTFTTEFDFEVGTSLNTSCILYGVDGPYMDGKTSFHFETVPSVDPCAMALLFGLEAIYDAEVGLEMDADVFDLDWTEEFELYTHPVANEAFPLGGSGTVVIDPSPNLIMAPWTLEGPCSQIGAGDRTLSNLSPGEYTLTWNDVSGHLTPSGDTQTLTANETVTFSGTYIANGVGTIEIEQTPDNLPGGRWSLAGPQNVTGSGNDTLEDMPVGEYTLTWNVVGGYVTPAVVTQILTADETVTFSGTYLGDYEEISAGTFTMGSPTDEPGRDGDEFQHTVTLTNPFLMSTKEITNLQYALLAQWAYDRGYCTATSSSLRDALDGSTEELLDLSDIDVEISFSDGIFTVDDGKEDHPVREVTWYGAVAYCDWLNLQASYPRAYDHDTWECNGNDPYGANGYRLPTEAEWEYACRAGSSTAFANGEITDIGCNDAHLAEIGWYCGSITDSTQPVGTLAANSFGLYDMHGNVLEWSNDWWGSYNGDETNPVGGPPGTGRVIRGGSWSYNAQYCRSANRGVSLPTRSGYDDFGFRPVRSTN